MTENKQLTDRIKEFILLGYDNYSDLPEMERDELLCLSIVDDDDWVLHPDILSDIRIAIRSRSYDDLVALGDTLVAHANQVYQPYLEELYLDTAEGIQIERMKDAGLSAHVDKVNGEVTWQK